MKKAKIKHRKKFKRWMFFVIILFLIVFIAFFLIYKISLKLNNKIAFISEMQASKLSKAIVNYSINEIIADKFDTNEIFNVIKNDENVIQMLSLDSKKANELLKMINSNILYYFDELENGKSTIVNLEKNLLDNLELSKSKKGIAFEIPIGMFTNNIFLSNIGPKIPVRVSVNGEVESSLNTKIESYGINNALLNVYVNIKVSEQIVLPISTKKITIENNILVAARMIQGSIPNYYFEPYGINAKG